MTFDEKIWLIIIIFLEEIWLILYFWRISLALTKGTRCYLFCPLPITGLVPRAMHVFFVVVVFLKIINFILLNLRLSVSSEKYKNAWLLTERSVRYALFFHRYASFFHKTRYSFTFLLLLIYFYLWCPKKNIKMRIKS